MKNPFQDFQSFSSVQKTIPLHSIIHSKETILTQISLEFSRLVEAEVEKILRGKEESYLAQIYRAALPRIQGLQYDALDIEDYLLSLDQAPLAHFPSMLLAEIFLAAMVNEAREDRLRLPLHDGQRTFHFLGYRLPRGKTLTLEGDGGNFIGAALAGGSLIVNGRCGDWCGASMAGGEIIVQGSAGKHTGSWMRGGEIRVNGPVQSIGKTLFGGAIYQKGKALCQP
jgi:hypothetical protein